LEHRASIEQRGVSKRDALASLLSLALYGGSGDLLSRSPPLVSRSPEDSNVSTSVALPYLRFWSSYPGLPGADGAAKRRGRINDGAAIDESAHRHVVMRGLPDRGGGTSHGGNSGGEGPVGGGDAGSPPAQTRPVKRRLMPFFRRAAGSGEFPGDGGARSSEHRRARRVHRRGAHALEGADAGGCYHAAAGGGRGGSDCGDPLDIDMLVRGSDDNDGGGGRGGDGHATGRQASDSVGGSAAVHDARNSGDRGVSALGDEVHHGGGVHDIPGFGMRETGRDDHGGGGGSDGSDPLDNDMLVRDSDDNDGGDGRAGDDNDTGRQAPDRGGGSGNVGDARSRGSRDATTVDDEDDHGGGGGGDLLVLVGDDDGGYGGSAHDTRTLHGGGDGGDGDGGDSNGGGDRQGAKAS
jgi:hypothetical protein